MNTVTINDKGVTSCEGHPPNTSNDADIVVDLAVERKAAALRGELMAERRRASAPAAAARLTRRACTCAAWPGALCMTCAAWRAVFTRVMARRRAGAPR